MSKHGDTPMERPEEYVALVELLMGSAVPGDTDAAAIAERIASASIQPGHLWRTMGLSDRGELRVLFETHFPRVAAGNTKDMRWKKYLYKLMCGWPGFEG
jgi:nitrogen fixation protein NifQ